jgi:beta-lactamase regulating signal transducer with metallopeptidase domain
MNSALITLLSLSAFGSVLALILVLLKPLMKNRVSKTFFYYLWLIVLVRLCLPFGVSLPAPSGWYGGASAVDVQTVGAELTDSMAGGGIGESVPSSYSAPPVNVTAAAATVSAEPSGGAAGSSLAPGRDASLRKALDALQTLGGWLTNPNIWLTVWAAGALLSLAWHLSGYIRFAVIIKRTAINPDEDDLAVFHEYRESGRVRLIVSEFVKTPMLLGILRPAVVLPPVPYVQIGMAESLRDILKHELTHYHRCDLFYKWFAVLVTSLHWFNPLMLFVRREIDRACELACDETVIGSLTPAQKQHYGETLMSLAVRQTYPLGILATTMCEDKTQLKERLVSIMKHKAKTRTAVLLSLVLLLGLVGCAAVSGVKETERAEPPSAEAVASPPESSPAAELDGVTLYEKYGLAIAIPNEIIDRLVITEPELSDGSHLISVYEKQSLEDARADFGDDAGMGFIFSIARYTKAQYEAFLASDGSGQSFFARDDTYYYGWFTATDVQFYRSGGEISTESDDWKKWEELIEKCGDIKTDFIDRNHVTAYSDSEFREQEHTWDSAHVYLSYYPYQAYPDTAVAQGFTWQDVAYTLILSQPAAQGDKGIWCVERWFDENGSLYYVFPRDITVSAADYYAGLQKAADSGGDTTLLTPDEAALDFVKEYFAHELATEDSFRRIDGEVAGNVWQLARQVFDDMGTLQAATIDASGNSTDREALAVPEQLKPISSYASHALYPYIWLKAEAPEKITGGVIYFRNDDGSKTVTFFEQGSLLCVNVDGTDKWYRPAYSYSKSSYDGMLGLYESFFSYHYPEPAYAYAQEEIDAATDAVYAFFNSKFTGCTLNSLSYDASRAYEAAESYIEDGNGSGRTINNVIVIFASFTTAADGTQIGLNPNSSYDDYIFILIRDGAGSPWTVDDWGY